MSTFQRIGKQERTRSERTRRMNTIYATTCPPEVDGHLVRIPEQSTGELPSLHGASYTMGRLASSQDFKISSVSGAQRQSGSPGVGIAYLPPNIHVQTVISDIHSQHTRYHHIYPLPATSVARH